MDNSHAAAQARAEEFNNLVQQLERSGGAPQQAQAQPAITPNADDLAYLAEIQRTAKNEDGQRLWDVDSRFRERVENARFAVCRGESIEGIKAATDRTLRRTLRGQPPAQQPAEAPAPPQGSPQERLEQELTERFAAGDYVGPKDYPDNPEVFRELSSGYNIGDLLPDGFGLGDVEAAQLAAAKRAGVSESQVRDIVRMLVQAQQ